MMQAPSATTRHHDDGDGEKDEKDETDAKKYNIFVCMRIKLLRPFDEVSMSLTTPSHLQMFC